MVLSFDRGISFKQHKDLSNDQSHSVDLNGSVDDYQHVIDSSGPLWGPGIRLQQTKGLTPQTLEFWRSYSEQPKSIRAEEELDKLYASLPEDKLDLTMKDIVEGRRVSPRNSPLVTPAKGGDSASIRSILGRKKAKEVLQGAAREDGGKYKLKNKIHNSTNVAFHLKRSPKRDKMSPDFANGSPPLSSQVSPSGEVKSSPRKTSGMSSSVSVENRPRSPKSRDGLDASDSTDRDASKDVNKLPQSTTPQDPKTAEYTSSVPLFHECVICSSSTLVFRVRCTACGVAYCSKCAKGGMARKPEGRKCRNGCANRGSAPRVTKKGRTGCWPLFVFGSNHVDLAEPSPKFKGERPFAYRNYENEMQRKSRPVSYLPTLPVTHPSPAKASSPRQSPEMVWRPMRMCDQRAPYSLPTGPMPVR